MLVSSVAAMPCSVSETSTHPAFPLSPPSFDAHPPPPVVDVRDCTRGEGERGREIEVCGRHTGCISEGLAPREARRA